MTWSTALGRADTPMCDCVSLLKALSPGPLTVQEHDATCLVPPDVGTMLDDFDNIAMRL